MKKLLFVVFLSSCGSDNLVTPEPSPSPSPTPIPVSELCEVRRVDIWAERTDKGNTGVVFSWPAGIVPLVHAELRYAGEDETEFDESECRQIDKVSWWVASGPPCEFLGNVTAETVYLKCNQPGTVKIKAQPQGFDIEAGEANFRVLP